MESIKRGDIFIVQFYGVGCIQNGVRPCVIVQNNKGNMWSPTTIVVPLTTKIKKEDQPTHEVIDPKDAIGLNQKSMALCEQLVVINKDSLIEKVGEVNEKMMKNIGKACSVSIGV